MTEARLAILERFSDSDMQDAVAEIRRLRTALSEIVDTSRDEGLSAMVNWMRGRALAGLLGIDLTLCEIDPVSSRRCEMGSRGCTIRHGSYK